jgi:hypothetical protein
MGRLAATGPEAGPRTLTGRTPASNNEYDDIEPAACIAPGENSMDIDLHEPLGQQARAASRAMARADTAAKNRRCC